MEKRGVHGEEACAWRREEGEEEARFESRDGTSFLFARSFSCARSAFCFSASSGRSTFPSFSARLIICSVVSSAPSAK